MRRQVALLLQSMMSKCALSWNTAKRFGSGSIPIMLAIIDSGSNQQCIAVYHTPQCQITKWSWSFGYMVAAGMPWLGCGCSAVRNVNSYNAFSCEIKCRVISYYEMAATWWLFGYSISEAIEIWSGLVWSGWGNLEPGQLSQPTERLLFCG